MDRNQYLLNILEDELDSNNGAAVSVESMLERMKNDRDEFRNRTTNWKSRCFFIFMIPFCIMMITNHLLKLSSSTTTSGSGNDNEEDNNSNDEEDTITTTQHSHTAIIIMNPSFLNITIFC